MEGANDSRWQIAAGLHSVNSLSFNQGQVVTYDRSWLKFIIIRNTTVCTDLSTVWLTSAVTGVTYKTLLGIFLSKI